jgi:hypothetical protein
MDHDEIMERSAAVHCHRGARRDDAILLKR